MIRPSENAQASNQIFMNHASVVVVDLLQILFTKSGDFNRERDAFVDFIARNPKAGDVIPETGGVRKVRWGRAGTGRRGGARVIYFYHDVDRPIYLLMAYAKARRENLTPEEKRNVRRLVAILKAGG